MKDIKYLFAYTVPLAAYMSFMGTGIWTYALVIYAFIFIPFLDVVTGEGDRNLSDDDAQYKKTKWIFDWMLYVNLPLGFGLLLVSRISSYRPSNGRMTLGTDGPVPEELGWSLLVAASLRIG